MAIVGQQLTLPEIGWKRYDDSDLNISYLNHTTGTGTSYWNNSCTMINSGGYARFNFTGDKLRIISYMSFSQSILSLYIDGIYIGDFNAYVGSGNAIKILAFDIQNLENREHYVELKYNGTKTMITLDAIDIGEDSVLKPYNFSLPKYLIKQNNQYYTIKSEFYPIGQDTLTKEMVDKYGSDSLTNFTNTFSTNSRLMTNGGVLGAGQQFSVDLNGEMLSLNDVSIE